MKEMDLRALQSQKIPEELMGRLRAIPSAVPEKRAVIVWSRRVVAAIGLVLVTVLSLGVYFLFGNKNELPIALSSSETEESTPAVQTEFSSETAHGLQVQAAETQLLATQPSEDMSVAETQLSTASAMTETDIPPATEAVFPSSEPSVPTAAPTQKPSPTKKPEPTQITTQTPTQKPTSGRLIPPPEPWDETSEGSNSETPVYPTAPERKNYCYAYFRANALTGSGRLFCQIWDESGEIMGDPDPLSAQHEAEIVVGYSNGFILARYSAEEHGMRPAAGYHRYGFINESGELIFEDYVKFG